MAELANWWPGRGKNPHTCGFKPMAVKTTKKDLPAPKKTRAMNIEKALIDRCAAKMKKGGLKVPKRRKRIFKRPNPKPLIGSWRVWYQVSDVAKLTLEQADRLLHGYDVNPKNDHDHYDKWWSYEPRTLWVDITYPLSRGVRLVVKPVVMKRKACRVCTQKFGKSRRRGTPQSRMSPGILMWAVAQEYVRIYEAHEKYGVWGHGMGDLAFERIDINKDGVVRLFIGS